MKLMKTYPKGTLEAVWEAFFVTASLFDEAAAQVAERLGFKYDKGLAARQTEYARRIKELPRDATEILQ